MTRSIEELWRGNFALALRFHPLGPIVFVLLAALAGAALAHWLRPVARDAIESAFVRLLSRRLLSPVACLILLIWAVRLVLEACHVPAFIW